MDRVRLLTVCGSLQARSANRAVLEAATAVARADGAEVDDFSRLADVPAFDADRADDAIAAVAEWRRQVATADAVLVAAPEYAGALAGAVKNAFDWLVGSGELYRKPVALLSAGTTGGLHARRMMAQTLTWQGAYVVGELGVASARAVIGDDGHIRDDRLVAAVAGVTRRLLAAPAMAPGDMVDLATRTVAALDVDVSHVPPPA